LNGLEAGRYRIDIQPLRLSLVPELTARQLLSVETRIEDLAEVTAWITSNGEALEGAMVFFRPAESDSDYSWTPTAPGRSPGEVEFTCVAGAIELASFTRGFVQVQHSFLVASGPNVIDLEVPAEREYSLLVELFEGGAELNNDRAPAVPTVFELPQVAIPSDAYYRNFTDSAFDAPLAEVFTFLTSALLPLFELELEDWDLRRRDVIKDDKLMFVRIYRAAARLLHYPETPVLYHKRDIDGMQNGNLDPTGFLEPRIDRVTVLANAAFDQPLGRGTLERGDTALSRATIREAGFVWGEMRLTVSGAFEVDANGYPVGEIRIEAREWRQMLRLAVRAGVIGRGMADDIARGIELFTAMTGGGDVLSAPFGLSGGKIRLLAFPIADAPRFPVPRAE